MLERQAIVLRDWAPAGSPDSGRGQAKRVSVRALLDPAEGEPLGVARREPGEGAFLLRWLRPTTLAVHEADDEPLVFTLHRIWGLSPWWEVRDADGHVVGSLTGRLLHDRYGRCLARVEHSAQPGRFLFVSTGGQEISTLVRSGGQARLAFGRQVEGDPFAKMLLLAAALVLS